MREHVADLHGVNPELRRRKQSGGRPEACRRSQDRAAARAVITPGSNEAWLQTRGAASHLG